MTFQVGDKVSYNDFCTRRDSQIPAGSVILFPSGDAHVLNPDGLGFIFKTGIVEDLGGLIGSEKHFTIIYIPDADVSERDDLAFEIYRFMSPDTTHPDAKHFRDKNTSEFWAFKAADYVLGKYRAKSARPDLIDADGDRWVWSEAESAYRSPDLPHMEPKTEEYIREWYSPIREAA